MTGARQLRILACQIEIPPMTTAAERDRHLAATADQVRAALRETPADLVVLPELASMDYARASFDRLDQLAEPLEGASFHTWSALARDLGVHVLYGFARREGDRHFISVAAVDAKGALIGHYDKLHLAQFGASMEKEYFSRGSRLLILDVCGFRLAPVICYDIRIPELSRALAVGHGVDAILHCGAYFRDASFHSWHAFVTTRAIENQCYVLSLNRAGADYGHSILCRPWQDGATPPTVFPEHRAAMVLLRLDRDEIAAARAQYSFLRDRLESYDLPC
ncbi:MAG: carbon-nitrogen hydrolase family protein [Paracoccaceae bacterium]